MWSVRPLVVFVVGVAACAAWQPRRRGPSAAQLAPLPTIAIEAGPLGPLALGPRRFAGGFALGLARDADPAEVDAQVAAWAEGMRGVTAARRGTDEVP